jgi:hypothetical protein
VGASWRELILINNASNYLSIILLNKNNKGLAMKFLLRAVACLFFCVSLHSFGALSGRDFDGNIDTFEAFYDEMLDITWLADANYAQTSGYDVDGKMSWAQAKTWAASLALGEYTDWRLPTINTPDSACSIQNGDVSYGTGCETGEFSSLYNMAIASTVFSNLQTGYYWSETPTGNSFFTYRLSIGHQGFAGTAANYAWAVHDGDIGATAVPLPAGNFLFFIGTSRDHLDER